MTDKFFKHIEDNFPFLHNGKLLVAVSGGLDSMVLAHLCIKAKLKIAIAHCNFKLRDADSDMDEEFVRAFAKKSGVQFFSANFDTASYAKKNKISVQMAARELRYQWFEEIAKESGFDHILTAHHADDVIETFLINLSRGAGLDGLTGIPAINDNIARPLLPFAREDILHYAKDQKLSWREDGSNAETKYLRNKIRHEIVPSLKELNPSFIHSFQRTLRYLNGSQALVAKHINEYKQVLFNREDGVYRIPISHLKNLNPRPAYLYELFKEFGFTEWDDVAALIDAQTGKQIFSKTHRLLKDRESLFIQEIQPKVRKRSFLIEDDESSTTKPINLKLESVAYVLAEGPRIAHLDKEKLKFPLTVRRWENGDYFYPAGMQGKKKLSKFFKDEKFSLIAKENQWLLCDAEHIVWVIGKRLDERFKVTKSTKQILKITYTP
ncbi:tRNA lysidine(34) synthetase TilS [Sungkyunkwania multivorans]|uniref:tRNA(Ile)-lysidine synthase n=1 Tax=Sungkyunkwania multivorans TaxID=1173618 RepID=A0ABW3CT76_9FLAO